MASFRVHEDQENRTTENNRLKMAGNGNNGQTKRTVLGVIDNRLDVLVKTKQIAEPGNSKVLEENARNKENNIKSKAVVDKKVVVPVAQFEAFKVYEDEEQQQQPPPPQQQPAKQPKHVPNNPYSIYKEQIGNRFITKTELAEIEKKPKGKAAECPMSIEKSENGEPKESSEVVTSGRSSRDIFFEVEDYRAVIYQYLREHELMNRPKPGYMKKQPDITDDMRRILVDWLVEVAEEYKLHTETLYLAVNYIDRFLSYMSVVRGKLQLVGTAAMYIASKYEDIFPPQVSEFVYITDDTYNTRQVLRMEHLILKVLSFDLSIPTPLAFITAMCISNKFNEKTMYLAMYLSELAILETEAYLETLPSVLAASAIALARHTLKEELWTAEMSKTTGYELKHLKKTIEFLHDAFVKAPTLQQQAIQEKYRSVKYLHVSKLTPRDLEF